MATFIECDVKEVEVRFLDETMKNRPVNIDLCQKMKKEIFYAKVPTIVFVGCDENWVFNSTEERDKQYDKILTNYWTKDGVVKPIGECDEELKKQLLNRVRELRKFCEGETLQTSIHAVILCMENNISFEQALPIAKIYN